MSWSYKIILMYVVFITGIMSMVYIASKQTNEMQEDNYYARELKYQDIIDAKNNFNAIGKKISITSDAENILVKIPTEASVNIENGTIYFLRPSDESKDYKVALNIDGNNEKHIPISSLSNGLYVVKISWKSNGRSFYSEQSYNVPK